MKTPELVLIDLDGTLVDSVPDLAPAVDRMLSDLGRPAAGEARVRDWVGNGVERLVKRALTGTLEGEPEAELYEQAYPLFMQYYSDNTAAHSRLYPGVEAGLEALRRTVPHLACVTNKAERFTLPLLEHLGIAGVFELVVSGDTLPQKKPDPAPLLHAAEFFNVSPEHALMVGDSINDVRAARAAGYRVVCVPYGYNHGLDIRDAEPDAVIETLADLPGLLNEE